MPESNNKQNNSLDQFSANVAKAAGAVANAVKAAAKAAAGDIAGAVLDVLRDETLRNAIICIILLFAFLCACCSMMIGSAIIGTIESILQSFQEGWLESWEESGIKSGGSSLYMLFIGIDTANSSGSIEILKDIWTSIKDFTASLFTTTNKADNSSLEENGGTNIDAKDYETTIASIQSLEALASADGALQTRLDMIKERVKQRGEQVSLLGSSQYILESMALLTAQSITAQISDPFLYNGLDLENSSVNFDMDAFDLTDIQALKILAAYSIQKDCSLTDINMWDLMNYCGWYDLALGNLTAAEATDTIYDTNVTGNVVRDIAGISTPNAILSSDIYQLATPHVPYWRGTFAPQWYYEERAQIRELAKKYYIENEVNENTDLAIAKLPSDSELNSMIDYDNFENLSKVKTYGIIDRLYTSANASLIVDRTEYTGADAAFDEALSKFAAMIDNATGGLISSAAEFFLGQWTNAFSPLTNTTVQGNLIERTSDNLHTFTFTNPIVGNQYFLRNESLDVNTDIVVSQNEGEPIVFSELAAESRYSLYRVYEVKVIIGYKEAQITPPGRPGRPERPGGPIQLLPVEGPPESSTLVPIYGTETKTEMVDQFTTLAEMPEHQAYQLRFELNVNFTAVSVDDLIYEIIGLWPSSLRDTEIGDDGKTYAHGHKGNPNLLYTWEDTYTDENGQRYTLTFERQQGYQAEAYRDIIMGVADLMEYDTTGLFSPDYGYGDTIVDMAQKEYDFYHANNLYEGRRYWEIAEKATGKLLFGYDAAWCACFVLCMAYLCDFIGPNQPFGDLGVDWKYWCGGLYEDLLRAGATSHTYGYTPVPGDIIFFDYQVSHHGDYTHVGIVETVNEDGTMTTLEGNFSNVISRNHFTSCNVGTKAYIGEDSRPIVIAAYVHPNYPSTYLANPIYHSIGSTTSPKVTARQISMDDKTVCIAGFPRFRESQFQTVVTELKERYPALYSEDLQTALDAGDMDAFIKAWNNISMYGKHETFKVAQQNILTKKFVQPIVSTIRMDTGFNWTATQLREEVLLSIVTTSDKEATLINILKLLSKDMSNDISDEEFLAALQTDLYLYTVIYTNRSILWPNDPEHLQVEWASGIAMLLNSAKDLLNQDAE